MTDEGVRRAKLAVVVMLLFIALGLVPVLFVKNKVAYFAVWSAIMVVVTTSLLIGLAKLLGRINRRTSGAVVLVAALMTAVLLAVVGQLIRP